MLGKRFPLVYTITIIYDIRLCELYEGHPRLISPAKTDRVIRVNEIASRDDPLQASPSLQD